MPHATRLILALLLLLLAATPAAAQMTIIDQNGDLYQLPLDCSEVRSVTFADGFAELRCQGGPGPAGDPGHGAGPDGGQSYVDGQGNNVFVPCGEIAFADQMVLYSVGNPAPPADAQSPQRVLGEPDYVQGQETGDLTLGCGGSVTVAFTRVYLVDVPGDDLHIFEVGPDVEPSQVEISTDGMNWINLGRVEGGKASLDIGPYTQPGQRFSYVRITDLRSHCNSQWPGADIDAVAAVGCTPR